MTRIILDIPSEKVNPFIKIIRQLGIEKNAIISSLSGQDSPERARRRKMFRSFTDKLPSIGWDFFSNELEFE